MHKIVEVFTEYFKQLEEESIRDNFVVIYELLDEMMDFGYPQTTESKILQEYVHKSVLAEMVLTDPGTLHRNRINSRFKRDHPLQSQMLSVGEARESDIERTRYSWMLLNHSIC